MLTGYDIKEYDLALTGVLFSFIFVCFSSSLLCQARSGQEPEFLMVFLSRLSLLFLSIELLLIQCVDL